jgi:hypothetical protein
MLLLIKLTVHESESLKSKQVSKVKYNNNALKLHINLAVLTCILAKSRQYGLYNKNYCQLLRFYLCSKTQVPGSISISFGSSSSIGSNSTVGKGAKRKAETNISLNSNGPPSLEIQKASQALRSLLLLTSKSF